MKNQIGDVVALLGYFIGGFANISEVYDLSPISMAQCKLPPEGK
jgi:hypothetical protein